MVYPGCLVIVSRACSCEPDKNTGATEFGDEDADGIEMWCVGRSKVAVRVPYDEGVPVSVGCDGLGFCLCVCGDREAEGAELGSSYWQRGGEGNQNEDEDEGEMDIHRASSMDELDIGVVLRELEEQRKETLLEYATSRCILVYSVRGCAL